MTKKRRVTYSQDAFRAAVSAYRDRTLSSVDASRKFGVPESTIRKHKNKTKNRIGSGHPFLLTKEQEEYLIAFMTNHAPSRVSPIVHLLSPRHTGHPSPLLIGHISPSKYE